VAEVRFNVTAGVCLSCSCRNARAVYRELMCLIDLTPLFNWNTKQLFLYFGAEYTDAQGVCLFLILGPRDPVSMHYESC
jgi:hypothetical protein